MARVSDTLIDTIFDGRYRIVRRLGAGGMANVYLAEDGQLGRRVAIKILNDRFAEDESFVERFQREAKSAASLSHPNIVSIYDRGEAEGTYYIAMEVVEGKSLKELIRTSGRLRPAQAIAYTRQILSALRFAHRNGIVHRDIKPHNILVGPEERLKVTDFGIARAGASQMTETGSIMGTAQYLSPEQARGAQVTGASDLYSMGVVLFEMLTGEVPFTGDTPVEIAMKHLNEPPDPPSARAPEIPTDLDRVVLRALAKSPDDRYASAEELDSDLARIEAGLPVAQETAEAATQVLAGAGTASTQVLRQPETPPPRRPPPPDPYAERRRRKRSIWPWLLVVLLVAGAAVAGWYVYQRVQDQLDASKPVPVPLVVGIKQKLAVQKIENAGLQAAVSKRSDDTVPAGIVIEQNPNAGTRISKNETVKIVVSTGVAKVKVPKVVGLAVEDAVQALNDQGLQASTKEVFSDKADPGIVLSQDPTQGDQVEKGSTVTLKVSKGVQTVAVPDVLQQSQESAIAELEQAGLKGNVVSVQSDQSAGLVISQSPDPGVTVNKGASVEIDVSEGPPPAPETTSVPGVIGQDEASATSALEDVGLRVSVQDVPTLNPDQDGVVVDQDPSEGNDVDPGSAVTIFVARFPGAATS